VSSGEVFGFLGPNGAGKSTTVKMLTTLLTITSGTARVAGVDIREDPDEVRRRIGVALQEAGLDPRQTGRELLVLQARLFGLSPGDAAERAESLLALVELEDAADRSIKAPTVRRLAGSRPVVGSSRNSTSGSRAPRRG
jgi:ABC-2 type transport system ATP-binding protein